MCLRIAVVYYIHLSAEVNARSVLGSHSSCPTKALKETEKAPLSMDSLRPICVNLRSRRKAVQALAAVVFLGIAFSVLAPTRRRSASPGEALHARSGCRFPAIFNFGDSNSDTGGKSAAFHRLPYPNGETFFHRPSGRYCDGKVVLDFVGEKLRIHVAIVLYCYCYITSLYACLVSVKCDNWLVFTYVL